MSISTKRGDDGTTGLLHGGRVRKDSARIEINGAIDEAQAALGLARAEVRGSRLDDELAGLERGLWVVMAEVATAPRDRRRLVAGATLVTGEMVDGLERRVHELEAAAAMPSGFVVPGQKPDECGAGPGAHSRPACRAEGRRARDRGRLAGGAVPEPPVGPVLAAGPFVPSRST